MNVNMSCVKLLAELDAYINQSKKSIMGNKKVVDYDEIMALINAVRESLPNDIKQAQYLMKQKEQIISEAKAEAEKTVQEANSEAELIGRNAQRDARETTKQAQSMADETIRMAHEDAEIIVKEAKQSQLAMIDQNQITKIASEQAKNTVEEAKKQAREIRIGGRDYVDDMLAKLENYLEKNLNEVKQNRSSL